MFIDGFGISAYRSFGIEIQFVGPCNKINFLIGQNNSGKSNILRFIKDHFQNALASTRHPNNRFTLSGLDRHQGESSTRFEFAFGLKPDGLLVKQIFKNRKIQENDRTAILTDYLLQFPEMTQESEIAWFVYKTDLVQALTISDDLITKIAENRLSTAQSSAGNMSYRDLELLLSHFANRRWSGGHNPEAAKEVLSYILPGVSPAQLDIPDVTIIEAIREIKSDSSKEEFNFNGLNIIKELDKLERPDADDEEVYYKSKALFKTINRFVGDVIGSLDARLEVPASKKTIQVKMNDKTLPLENLGTGIHEVIILAIAATLLNDQIICIEEPEIHLHPLLQKKLVQYLDEHTTNQYFITTHSASMIDIPGAAVFHVKYNGERSIVTPALSISDRFAICTDLGYRASDILQTNCIIWVEGPSDRIYLNHWLNSHDSELQEGIHYSIMFYGGRLLSHLSADDEEIDEFISLRKINQNLAILIDSDREEKGRPMNSTKCRIRDEFDKGPGFAWITTGREIENYVPVDIMEKAVKSVHRNALKLASTGQYKHCYYFKRKDGGVQKNNIDKVKIAKHVAQSDAEFDVFDLSEKIRKTVRFIRQSNDLREND